MTIRPHDHSHGITPMRLLSNRCACEKCHQPTIDGLPLCEGHAADVAVYMDRYLKAKAEAEERDRELRRQAEEWRAEDLARWRATMDRRASSTFKTEPGMIYYLRVGEHIKIGYTKDLDQRLRAYPPVSILLATHPGTMRTEKQMHNKFAEFRAAGREWFTPSAKLDAHLTEVRAQYKQDKRVAA